MTSVVLIVAGISLVLVVLREVFHSLFHPSGHGGLTMVVFKTIWRLSGSIGPGARALAGPVSLVCVIALWVGGTVVGWALIYLPALPGGFIFASALTPAEQSGFLVALYHSWVTQATLGYGDIAPEAAALRILAPLQATLGFALFTLVVTWVLSIYPALQRQRAAAALAHALRASHHESGTSTTSIHPAAADRQMERLSQAVDDVRVDLTQYPSTFYFAAPAGTLSLATAIPFVVDAAEAHGYEAEAQAGAAELASSLDLLATTIGEQHLGMPDAAR
ncbi:MAG: potassium channel family protein, partial [Thermoleophilia bacterium]